MKKKLILTSILSLLLCSFYFFIPFHFLIFNKIFLYAIHNHLGEELGYKDAKIDNGKLIYTHPSLSKTSPLVAESLSVNYRFDPFKLGLEIFIHLERPKFQLNESIESEWKTVIQSLNKNAIIPITPIISISKGSLLFPPHDLESPLELLFDFTLDVRRGFELKGSFEPSSSATSNFTLSTFTHEGKLEARLVCDQLHIPSIARLCSFFDPIFKKIVFTSGHIGGTLNATFPDQHIPFVEGTMRVNDLVCFHPDLSLKISAQQASFLLENSLSLDSVSSHPIPFSGTFILSEPASLEFNPPTRPDCGWSAHQIYGQIQLRNIDEAKIDFKGEGECGGYNSPFRLVGKSHLNSSHEINFDLTLDCSTNEKQGAQAHLLLTMNESRKMLEMQYKRISPAEGKFFISLFSLKWPQLKNFMWEKGEFNGKLSAIINPTGIDTIHFHDLQFQQLQSSFINLDTTCSADLVKGNGSFKLSGVNFFDSLNTELHIENGRLDIQRKGSLLTLNAIQTHLKIENGGIPQSTTSFYLGKLKGMLDVEWYKNRELIDINLQGHVIDLYEYIPNQLQEGLSSFKDDRLGIMANIKKNKGELELTGTLHVDNEVFDQPDLIHFGCFLHPNQFISPFSMFSEGWFYARNLPLEKFISPFLFKNHVLTLKGLGEFIGTYHDAKVNVKYKTDHLIIENEDLLIEASQLPTLELGYFAGNHHFDLTNYSHEGSLPFQYASYLEKNSHLVFNDLQGVVHFKNQSLTVQPMEAFCLNNYFCGTIDLDYSDPAPGVFSIKVNGPIVSGSIPQIQKLLSHISKQTFLQRLPLEGELLSSESGLSLFFNFFPGDYNLKAFFKGSINDGYLPGNSYNLSLRGLYMDVDFDHENHKLAFSDIQGAVLVGKGDFLKEYPLKGEYIAFDQLDSLDFRLDLGIFDEEREFIHLAGHTKDLGDHEKEWICDYGCTHISQIYPKKLLCRFKDWEEITEFQFSSEFPLAPLFKDISCFKQTGLAFLTPGILEQISHLNNIQGNILVDFSYEPQEKESIFVLSSQRLQIGKQSFIDPLIKIRRRGSRWSVETVKWNQTHFFAELDHLADSLRVNTMGLSIGNSILLGLSGDFIFNSQIFDAKINFCEANLEDLKEYPAFEEVASMWKPKGQLQGTGKLCIKKLSQNPWFTTEATLSIKMQNFSLGEINFNINNPFSMHFELGKEIVCEQIEVMSEDPQKGLSFTVKQFGYAIDKKKITCTGLDFSIPYRNLNNLCGSLRAFFPEINNERQASLSSLKKEGFLQGILSFSKDETQYEATLSLSDGCYFYKDHHYDLKKPNFFLLNNKLQFSAYSFQEQTPYSILWHASWPEMDQGSIVLISQTDELKLNPLIINWEDKNEQGHRITSVQGEFQGIKCQLDSIDRGSSSDDWDKLSGVVHVDLAKCYPLMPAELQHTLADLSLGSEFSLNGLFCFKPHVGVSLFDTLCFKGQFFTSQLLVKSFQLDNMTAFVQYSPHQLDIYECSIDDVSGTMNCPKAFLFKNATTQQWQFYIPDLTVKSLKPDLLRYNESKFLNSPRFKSMVCKKMSLSNFQGYLNDLSSWTADGYLQFLNSTRKTFTHPLFAIPNEIVLRIGLDPHVLNPVTGTIFFNWIGHRFYLTKFKDVYSEGRGSKFYLAKSPTPSWIDINGQLSVFVGMRQYNLIFKIAELFTVSIDGSLSHPLYHLQKQSKAHKK